MKISTKENLELVGLFAVIVSLLFVGYELRLSRSIAQTQGLAEMSALNSQVKQMQIDNAEIWHKGCVGEELSPVQKLIFAKIFRATLNRYFAAWARGNIGVIDSNPSQFVSALAMSRYRFQGFNEFWVEERMQRNANLEYFIPENSFADDVEQMYQDLITAGAPKNVDPAFCVQ